MRSILSEKFFIGIIFLLAFILFEGYIFDVFFLLGFCFVLLLVYVLLIKKEIKLNKIDLLWILIFFIWFVGALYSVDIVSGVKYSLMLGCILGIVILLKNLKEWQKYFIKGVYLCSSVHVIATILRPFFPVQIETICEKILSESEYKLNMLLMVKSGNPGITFQTGWNAFYISIFIAISFCLCFFKNRKSFLHFILLICGGIALFLTSKRGLLISNFVSMIVIFFTFSGKSLKEKIKHIGVILLLVIIIYIAIVNIPDMQKVINRFDIDYYSDINSLSSGRTIIYKDIIEQINTVPRFLFGVGTGSTDDIIGVGGHNIYLQILFENGVIGLMFFLTAFLLSLWSSFKIIFKIYIKKQKKDENYSMAILSIYIQIFFLIYGLFGNPLYDTQMLATYLIMVELLSSYNLYLVSGETMKNE